jgi:DUF2075 family protein
MDAPAMKVAFLRRIIEMKGLILNLVKGDAVSVKVWAAKNPRYYTPWRNRLRNLRRCIAMMTI